MIIIDRRLVAVIWRWTEGKSSTKKRYPKKKKHQVHWIMSFHVCSHIESCFFHVCFCDFFLHCMIVAKFFLTLVWFILIFQQPSPSQLRILPCLLRVLLTSRHTLRKRKSKRKKVVTIPVAATVLKRRQMKTMERPVLLLPWQVCFFNLLDIILFYVIFARWYPFMILVAAKRRLSYMLSHIQSFFVLSFCTYFHLWFRRQRFQPSQHG